MTCVRREVPDAPSQRRQSTDARTRYLLRPACLRRRHNYGKGNGERPRRMIAVKHAPEHWGMERQCEPHDYNLKYKQRRGGGEAPANTIL